MATPDFNLDKAVPLALPASIASSSPVLLAAIPVTVSGAATLPATATALLQSTTELTIGLLRINRSFALRTKPALSLRAPTEQVVAIQTGQITLIENGTPTNRLAGIRPDIYALNEPLPLPEATITIDRVCFAWHAVRVCLPISSTDILSTAEREQITKLVQAMIDRFVSAGYDSFAHRFAIEKSLPDVERPIASRLTSNANFVVTPVSEPLPDPSHWDINTPTLVGLVQVGEATTIPPATVIPSGEYRIIVTRRSATTWEAELAPASGHSISVPVHVRSDNSRLITELSSSDQHPTPAQPSQVPQPPELILMRFCFKFIDETLCIPH